jgi:hypothetical protein
VSGLVRIELIDFIVKYSVLANCVQAGIKMRFILLSEISINSKCFAL